MSYRPRTKEQKLRRKYLRDCKRHGVEPMQIDYWKEYNKKLNADWKPEFANKTSKSSCKSVKPAKKVCGEKQAKPITKKGRNVIVERGDLLIFNGYKPREIMRLAMLMLVDVYKDICASNSRHNHNS